MANQKTRPVVIYEVEDHRMDKLNRTLRAVVAALRSDKKDLAAELEAARKAFFKNQEEENY